MSVQTTTHQGRMPSAPTTGADQYPSHPLRAISFNDPAVGIERTSDGTIYLRPNAPLGDRPPRLTERLHHWASVAPDRVFMAERAGGRGWRELTYVELLTASRHI